ncbi:MAG TPA: hypothetical protein VGM88_23500 [Kofleriaceae bacterium]|jgi:hypothetical protein
MRALVLVLVLAACGPGDRSGSDNPDANGHDSPADAPVTHPPDGSDGESLVYAHSGTMLYVLDSTTFAVSQIGAFNIGGTSITDLAVDKNGAMSGVSLQSLYTIDPTTGAATLVRALDNSASGATSLSYIPSDLTDPTSADILVTANDQGDVFQIDPTTGDATSLGSYGTVAAGRVVSSGDLIGVRGFGIYATVNVGTDTSTDDYLAKIDPTTWKATPLGTGTGYKKIFGLGFWAGTIYGFVDDGNGTIISIDPNTGAGTDVAHGTQGWFGAGVTTSAPIIGRTL